jgi:putative membrane protein
MARPGSLTVDKPFAPEWLPPFNTALIVVSGVFLIIGLFFIRRKQVALHRASMLTATTFAALFLVVYVSRYVLYAPKHFEGRGALATFYYAVLGSHMVLAVAQAPLVVVVLTLALRGNFARHRQLARIVVPIWLYVVVTGWLIYGLLYLR